MKRGTPNTGYRTITVTQQNIDEGCKSEGGNCPIAPAMIAQGYCEVFVNRCVAMYTTQGQRHWRGLPPSAVDFVDAFDGRYSGVSGSFTNGAEPFEFRLPR